MKKYIILAQVLLLVMAMQACDDFLKENPKSFSTPDLILKSKAGIREAVNGIYNAHYRLYRGRYFVMDYGLPTDELMLNTTNASRIELERYTFTPENSNLSRIWETNVYGISRANMVLDNYIPDNLKQDPEVKVLLGEAYFLRGWFYFNQVRTYGSVPLVLSYSKADVYPANAPISDIYPVIISDLKEAVDRLPGWMDYTGTTDAGRVTRGAAKALLARVYLTKATTPEVAEGGDYQKAADYATDVIQNEGYGLWDKYADVFLPVNENGKEDVFSIQFEANTNYNNSINADFTPNPSPQGQAGYDNFSLTDALYNTFEPGDDRLNSIIKGDYLVNGTDTYTTPGNRAYTVKYFDPDNVNRNNHGTNEPMIRYADVLLMQSEALNEMNGPTTETLKGINLVRARANLAPLGGLSKDELRVAIQNERFKEFHGEGMRWFDLTRWGILKERTDAAKAGTPNVANVPGGFRFFPIPQTEIDANPNLKQNDVYASGQ